MASFIVSACTTNSLSASTMGQWGIMSASTFNSYTGAGYTGVTNFLGTSGTTTANADYTASTMDTWYYAAFDPQSGNNYDGISFNSVIGSNFGPTATPGSFSGTVSG
ncbi:MAG: hypothetical protein ACK55Z_26285, partial [bacterium]